MSTRYPFAPLCAVLLGAILLLAACGGGAVNPTVTAPSAAAPSAAAPSVASSSHSLPGVLHGGQAPITGSTLTLYVAGVPASAAPMTLATAFTDGNGNFNFQYTCPSPTALVYVVASGGNAGGGSNPAIKLMAALGSCNSLPPFIVINELTTVAAVYALNAFSAIGSGSGGLSGCVDCTANADGDMTQLHGNAPAINNSFATAALLANVANGEPARSLPAPASCTGTSAPVNCSALGRLTALANSLAACVNSASGSTQCTNLMNVFAGGSDALRATLFIARNPGLVNIVGIYRLSTPNEVFSPGLTAPPSDWTIALNFTGGGLNAPFGIAIDGVGNVWAANLSGNSVTELNAAGSALSPAGGFIGGGLTSPASIAIDGVGNVWVANPSGSVTELNAAGSALSPAGGFIGGGLTNPTSIAIDGVGNVWAANLSGNSVTELNAAGSALSPASGFGGGGLHSPVEIAIDLEGNVWVTNRAGVTKLSPAGSALSPALGFTGGGLNRPLGIAIDVGGNVWAANEGSSSVSELDAAGSALSPAGGFTGGGLTSPASIAIDGVGNVWVANPSGSVTELNASGSTLSPASGFTGGGLSNPKRIAIDASGNVWAANGGGNSVTEIIGAAASTVTPLVAQIINAATLTSIAVTPAAASVAKGTSQQYTATAGYSDAATGNVTSRAAWSSSNPAVASVTNPGGLVSCVTSGQVTIMASLTLQNGSTASGSTTLTCFVPVITLVSIAVTPDGGVTVTAPGTQQFAVTGTYSDGSQNAITTGVGWTVGGSPVATISTAGLAQCVGAGAVTVMATVAGTAPATAALTCQVSGPTLTGFTLAPLSASIAVGGTQQFTVTGSFSDGSTANITSLFSWASSNSANATITSPGGLATGILAGGPITITGTLLSTGATVAAQLTVTAAAAGLTCLPAPSPQGGGAQVYDNQSFCVQLGGTTDFGTSFTGSMTFMTPLTPGPIIGCQYLVSLSPAGTAPTACTGTTDASGNLTIVDAVNESNTNTKFTGIFAPSAIDTVTGNWSSGNFAPAGGAVVAGNFSGTQQ